MNEGITHVKKNGIVYNSAINATFLVWVSLFRLAVIVILELVDIKDILRLFALVLSKSYALDRFVVFRTVW
jgi:hypothetical protein